MTRKPAAAGSESGDHVSEADRARWNHRHRERGAAAMAPSSLVVRRSELLPAHGRALDVAGGSGRHAIWLARRGLEVTLVDISDVALELAGQATRKAGVSLRATRLDLEREPLPDGPWGLILVFHYLDRRLFPLFPSLLAPGGVLFFVQPTVTHLARHERPSRQYLLEDGELPRLVEGLELEVVELSEGWSEEGRHEAIFVGRRSIEAEGAPSSS